VCGKKGAKRKKLKQTTIEGKDDSRSKRRGSSSSGGGDSGGSGGNVKRNESKTERELQKEGLALFILSVVCLLSRGFACIRHWNMTTQAKKKLLRSLLAFHILFLLLSVVVVALFV